MSGDRTCERCGKSFRVVAELRRHLARKTPCAPILEPDDIPPELFGDPKLDSKRCRFCGRVFSAYDSMRRHVRQTCKIAPNEKNGNKGMERLYEHTLQRQVADLQGEVHRLTALVTNLATQQSTGRAPPPSLQAGEVAIQGDHAQVDNSKKIVINFFGQERIDHVTLVWVRAILDESLKAPALPTAADTAVLRTAMLVYSDPGRPENLTCYLPNKKTDDALVHTETGWEIQPTTLVLPPMAQKSFDTLFDKQPYEDADAYVPLLKELQQNEARYAAGEELRPILVRNKDLLARALKTLPLAGRE